MYLSRVRLQDIKITEGVLRAKNAKRIYESEMLYQQDPENLYTILRNGKLIGNPYHYKCMSMHGKHEMYCINLERYDRIEDVQNAIIASEIAARGIPVEYDKHVIPTSINLNKTQLLEARRITKKTKKRLEAIAELYPDKFYVVVNSNNVPIHNINYLYCAIASGMSSIRVIKLQKSAPVEFILNTLKKDSEDFFNLNRAMINHHVSHKRNVPHGKLRTLAAWDNYTCYICGDKVHIDEMQDYNSATIDHVFPKAKGGENCQDNKRCCCKFCNSSKSDRILTRDLIELISNQKKLLDGLNITSAVEYTNSPTAIYYKKLFAKQLEQYDAWYHANATQIRQIQPNEV